jgi:hypothetical protein
LQRKKQKSIFSTSPNLINRIHPLPLAHHYGSHILFPGLLNIMKDIIHVITITIITCVNSLVNIIPRPRLLHLGELRKYLFDLRKKFHIPEIYIIVDLGGGTRNINCIPLQVRHIGSYFGINRTIKLYKHSFPMPFLYY